MREQLIQYVELLFAGAPNSGEIKQEILQNTLDRYDDLTEQGKSPEAAYRLAISGIGDISEILSGSEAPVSTVETVQSTIRDEVSNIRKQNLRAVAVALYILCPVPLFINGGTPGLCFMFLFVAIATALMIVAGKNKPIHNGNSHAVQSAPRQASPQQELHKRIGGVTWAIGLAVYFILSFVTGGWHITWVIFPVIAAVCGLIKACMDLKEVNQHEK